MLECDNCKNTQWHGEMLLSPSRPTNKQALQCQLQSADSYSLSTKLYSLQFHCKDSPSYNLSLSCGCPRATAKLITY